MEKKTSNERVKHQVYVFILPYVLKDSLKTYDIVNDLIESKEFDDKDCSKENLARFKELFKEKWKRKEIKK